MTIGTYIYILTLNVNGLNAPTKRHRLPEWIHLDPYICYPQETHFRSRTHADWKWGDKIRYFIQMEIKRKQQ